MVSFFAAEAGGVNTGLAVEGIDFEAGVVGEDEVLDAGADAEGFESGVFEEGGSGFFDGREIGK